MSKKKTLPPLLEFVLNLEPARQQEWLARQTPVTRHNVKAMLLQYQENIKEEKWELKRQKRAAQAGWQEGEGVLHKTNQACSQLQQHFQNVLRQIYAHPQEAAQKLWVQAQQNLPQAVQYLNHRPEVFGVLRSDHFLMFELPTQFQARAAARNFGLQQFWNVYGYSFKAKQFLESRFVVGGPHG